MLINISKLVKCYRVGGEDVFALNGVSLKIRRGEYVAIMGPSGSGKSTLMNVIGCLDTPSSGDYYLADRNVSHLSDEDLASVRNKEIGFIFQTFNLLPRSTALQNVELPLIYGGAGVKERREQALDALNKVGLSDRVKHRPNEMSGGQRQRVAIARALVNNPSLILADEPTGNLDSRTSNEIMVLLHKIHEQGNSIVLVTHEDFIADNANRIVTLHDGMIYSDKQK